MAELVLSRADRAIARFAAWPIQNGSYSLIATGWSCSAFSQGNWLDQLHALLWSNHLRKLLHCLHFRSGDQLFSQSLLTDRSLCYPGIRGQKRNHGSLFQSTDALVGICRTLSLQAGCPAKSEQGEEKISSRTFDISVSGCFLTTDLEYQTGQKIDLNIKLMDPVDLQAEVVWVCLANENVPKGIGIRFISNLKEITTQVNRFKEKYSKAERFPSSWMLKFSKVAVRSKSMPRLLMSLSPDAF